VHESATAGLLSRVQAEQPSTAGKDPDSTPAPFWVLLLCADPRFNKVISTAAAPKHTLQKYTHHSPVNEKSKANAALTTRSLQPAMA
jgi:hypothetical protein